MVNVTSSQAQTFVPATATPDISIGFTANTSQFTYASPSGTVNNVTAGVPAFVGTARLAVTLAAGNATWTGLQAGLDNEHLILWNTDAANTLTLSVDNTGSLANHRFKGSAGAYALLPGNAILLVYYAGKVNGWVIVP